MTLVKNYEYVVTRLRYHICGICLSLSCHRHVILNEVPDCPWFSRINAGGYDKILYFYILTIHYFYRPSSLVILIPHSKVRSYGYMHVTGQQLSCMWQDNSCRTCDTTTVVVCAKVQQLSCVWQDNICRACDSTTVFVRATVQQLSCVRLYNICRACDCTTVVMIGFIRFSYIFEQAFWVVTVLSARWRINAGRYLLRFF